MLAFLHVDVLTGREPPAIWNSPIGARNAYAAFRHRHDFRSLGAGARAQHTPRLHAHEHPFATGIHDFKLQQDEISVPDQPDFIFREMADRGAISEGETRLEIDILLAGLAPLAYWDF